MECEAWSLIWGGLFRNVYCRLEPRDPVHQGSKGSARRVLSFSSLTKSRRERSRLVAPGPVYKRSMWYMWYVGSNGSLVDRSQNWHKCLKWGLDEEQQAASLCPVRSRIDKGVT